MTTLRYQDMTAREIAEEITRCQKEQRRIALEYKKEYGHPIDFSEGFSIRVPIEYIEMDTRIRNLYKQWDWLNNSEEQAKTQAAVRKFHQELNRVGAR